MWHRSVLPLGLHLVILSVYCLTLASAQPGPAVATWKLRSRHFKFGMPQCVDARYNFVPPGAGDEVEGLSVLVREGFVAGHCDKYKAPVWVSVQLTRDLLEMGKIEKRNWRAANPQRNDTPFRKDPELPDYAQAAGTYDYGNSRMQRGHMARQDDNWGWGFDNIGTGCYMSNIAPQTKLLNEGKAWRRLEDSISGLASDRPWPGATTQLWVITGAVYPDGEVDPDYRTVSGNQPAGYFQNGIGAPTGIYKLVIWRDGSRWQMRGYLFPQEPESEDPVTYLVPVDEIEALTGLDFFSEMNAELGTTLEARLEAFDPTSLPYDERMWGRMP